MFTLISTALSFLMGGLPKLLDFFQDRSDKSHELELARMQMDRELQMLERGYAAQARIEEIRTDQVMMQTEAQMTEAALKHDEKVLEKASQWVANYVGTVRPTVTYIFVLELLAINAFLCYYLYKNPSMISSIDDIVKYSELIFSSDEMAMLGGILGFWFGTRTWSKK